MVVPHIEIGVTFICVLKELPVKHKLVILIKFVTENKQDFLFENIHLKLHGNLKTLSGK